MSNRYAVIIDAMESALKKALADGTITETPDGSKLNISFDEFCLFQDKKSLAFASGKMSLEEAQFIYEKLGGTPDHYNAQSFATKYVLTRVFMGLLKPGG